MEAIDNNYNTRFLWITDSDLLRSNNATREREYFDFLIKLQSQNDISFSYLGYGEVPNWATNSFNGAGKEPTIHSLVIRYKSAVL